MNTGKEFKIVTKAGEEKTVAADDYTIVEGRVIFMAGGSPIHEVAFADLKQAPLESRSNEDYSQYQQLNS